MTGTIRAVMAVASVMLLASCAGTELEKAEMSPSQGTAFERNLHDGYVKLAEDEYNEGDYRDSDHFAMRALELSDGKNVQPEMIEARALPADKKGELTDARLRLMTAMSEGASQHKPLTAAEAQVSFDCWMQEQEENFQPADIAACRDRFMTAMAELEAKPEVAVVPPPAPEPMTPEAAAFTVLFDFDEADLSPDARTVLADVVLTAKKAGYETIDIGGYTDLVGSDAYNQVLSEQRANAVINFLVESGVEAGKIVGQGYGKADPVVAVQAPEIRNRRVEIKLEP
ncbi:OmpA family protein [Pelagibius sp. 7325]|uniref:OmpA family protein n=1 Tax=Pelagibius sp. 7325 TaxID=3131994 RepID=UPI0030EE07DD